MKERSKSPLSGMGGITVFMVLAVLTVAVFAVLTLTTAVADTNLSQKNADLVTAYYKADSQGIELLAALEQAWPQGSQIPDEEVFLTAAHSIIPDIDLTAWQMEDQVLFTAVFSVDERRTMEMEVVLCQDQDTRWQIVKWVFLPDAAGEIDDALPVWQF